MTQKEILHEILRGMDGYLSCGVPDPIWNVAVNLTGEIYGSRGIALLVKNHKINEDQVDYKTTLILHEIYGSEDNGNTIIGPEELIERLEKLS